MSPPREPIRSRCRPASPNSRIVAGFSVQLAAMRLPQSALRPETHAALAISATRSHVVAWKLSRAVTRANDAGRLLRPAVSGAHSGVWQGSPSAMRWRCRPATSAPPRDRDCHRGDATARPGRRARAAARRRSRPRPAAFPGSGSDDALEADNVADTLEEIPVADAEELVHARRGSRIRRRQTRIGQHAIEISQDRLCFVQPEAIVLQHGHAPKRM